MQALNLYFPKEISLIIMRKSFDERPYNAMLFELGGYTDTYLYNYTRFFSLPTYLFNHTSFPIYFFDSVYIKIRRKNFIQKQIDKEKYDYFIELMK